MCKYCETGIQAFPLEDEYGYGDWRLFVTKMTPIPVINLTTGQIADSADPPYWVLFLEEDTGGEFGAEQASFPIKFCPMCGRLLPTGPEVVTDGL